MGYKLVIYQKDQVGCKTKNALYNNQNIEMQLLVKESVLHMY